jgi:O-acetylhomoserine/O-acetylserine sulfhydrylase-like pyridoxal-dependent enzyme
MVGDARSPVFPATTTPRNSCRQTVCDRRDEACVCVSIGIEHIDDNLADLVQALKAAR